MHERLVSVIVPALNEAGTLEEVYSRTCRALEESGREYEVIFVNDGSVDRSGEILKRIWEGRTNVQVITHRLSHGKSVALMQGFSAARGGVAVTLDADLQDQPEEIPRLLEKLEEGFDLVNGWRRDRRDRPGRRLVSGLYNYLVSRLSRTGVHDVNCGLKAMTREVFQRLELRGGLHRLLPAIAGSYGFKVAEVEVGHAPRQRGASRYRLFRWEGLTDLVSFAAANTTRLRPFHIFSLLALPFLGLGLLGSLLLLRLAGDRPGLAILFGLGGLGGFLAAGLLPLFGLVIEMVSEGLQGREWRGKLVKEVLLPRD